MAVMAPQMSFHSSGRGKRGPWFFSLLKLLAEALFKPYPISMPWTLLISASVF